MNISFINGFGLLVDSGNGNYLSYLLPAMEKKGVRGTFYTPNDNDRAIGNINAKIIPGKEPLDLAGRLNHVKPHVDKALLDTDSDIINFHTIPAALWLDKFRENGKKVVVTHHGSGFFYNNSPDSQAREVYLMYKNLLKKADQVIVHSPIIKENYENEFDIPCTLLPLAVPVKNVENANLIAKKWQLSSKNYFLFIGRLIDEKGPDLAIRAYAKTKTKYPLIIAGPPRYDSLYASELGKIAINGGKVIFTGTISGRIKSELISNALSVVNPLKIQGLPLVVLESMGYGTPVISSDSATHHQAIQESYLFETENLDSLTNAMLYAIHNKDEMKQMGQANKLFIQKNHNIEDLADRYIDVYENVLRKNTNIAV